jgi:hypothetical protein
MSSVTAEPGDQGAGRYRREGHAVTDDSAFKKQVRIRMTETGEKYTEARRMVITGREGGRPQTVLRVYLNPHVDLELTGEAVRAYTAADEQGRREMVTRLLADQIEMAGFEEAGVATASKIVTDQELRAEAEAAQDAAIRAVVQRGVDRAVGVLAVDIDWAADQLRVDIRAARPILLAGPRGAEADRLRGELEELAGRRVRLNIRQLPDPQEAPEDAGSGRVS